MEIKVDTEFNLPSGNKAKITEVFAKGFHYHTYDKQGNCIKGQQYMLKAQFLKNHA